MRYFSSIDFSWRPLLQNLQRVFKPATSLTVAAGMTLIAPAAFAAETVAQRSSVPAALQQPIADGVYLYGQSTEAEQLGSAYMVFEVSNRQITGAFYMPYSSYDCFNGTIEANQLALNVVDSYEQASYPYAIGLEQSAAVATVGNTTIAPVQIEGFQRIDSVSENDRRILASCQTSFQEQPNQTPSAPGVVVD